MTAAKLSEHDGWVLWEAALPREIHDRELLERWHNAAHPGCAYLVCPEQPCHALNARHHWVRWGHL